MKELEEALAEEEETEPEKQEFLAGTKLTPPSAEREMKPVPAEEAASSEERVEMEESSQGQVDLRYIVRKHLMFLCRRKKRSLLSLCLPEQRLKKRICRRKWKRYL